MTGAQAVVQEPFARRRAGILLHPTSLPGRWGSGELGHEARAFVDFLAAAGQTVWQTLPLGPTHHDGSPYQCLSVQAGNPQLIAIDELIARGWLEEGRAQLLFAHTAQGVVQRRFRLLAAAYEGFRERADDQERAALAAFVEREAHWLEDFALYQALRREHGGRDWSQWPPPLRDREPEALAQARRRLAPFIAQIHFEQYLFFNQWQALKRYANERGVLLFGDLPIFVAYDSVDVWTQRHFFKLDEQGRPQVVAGVPPDYFSATGQRWGNPLYRWEAMEADGFSWWRQRVAMQLRLFDLVRIDHFRGFEASWEIPAGERTAVHGHWVPVPGERLFAALREHFGRLPFVAEDLGVITPEVTALRERYGLPGMRILQFAFEGGGDNPYLPHNHERHTVVYTGTHDNDTTLGWFQHLDDALRRRVMDYLGLEAEQARDMPWPLIRAAQASVAVLAMVPMQDVMGLDSRHRLNVPGIASGNWRWRFQWEQVPADAAARLHHLAELYGRL